MRELSAEICEYINKEWITPWVGSARGFADEHDIDEKTVRQIMDYKKKPYKIGLYTLEKICRSRKLDLARFFTLLGR